MSVADLVGPVIAGVLIDQAGHVRTYLLLGLFNVAAVIGLFMLLPRLPLPLAGCSSCESSPGET